MATGATVNLPVQNFLYTLDQIAYLLQINEESLKQSHIHFEGRSVGVCPRHKMVARNIAAPGAKPEWRVLDKSFVRWMRFKGYKIYERQYLRDE